MENNNRRHKRVAGGSERKLIAAVVKGNLNLRQSTDSFAVNGFKREKTVPGMYK